MASIVAWLVLPAALLMAGCGLEPILAQRDGRDVPAQLSRIAIDWVAERSGAVLRDRLRDELGRDLRRPARYRLVVVMETSESNDIVNLDATASWVTASVVAQYQLYDGGTALQDERVFVSDAYPVANLARDAFSLSVHQEDTELRLVGELAREISLRIANFFSQQP